MPGGTGEGALLSYIKQNPFFLAPMAGVTDKPFRSFMREMGCGIITTELVSARALKESSLRTKELMRFDESQRPVGIQIFGEDPEMIGEGARRAEEAGADFVDLNLGCPVRKIVKKGAGAALLKDLKALSKVLRAMRRAVSLPLSLKVRTGWDRQSLNADKAAAMAIEEGFSWLTIHGRTREQGYSGEADWRYIKEVKAEAPLPIIGNGDLNSGQRAVQALEFSGCDGVMIGRGCLGNPWIFLESLQKLRERNSAKSPPGGGSGAEESAGGRESQKGGRNILAALGRLQFHLDAFYDERLFLLQMKKFASWLSAGMPHSAPFRQKIFQEKDRGSALRMIEEFFAQNADFQKKPAPYDPFLMRGHG